LIQVLGLRDILVRGVSKKRETFFNQGWRFSSIQTVFNGESRQAILSAIPERDRHNLYFTVAECFETTGRKLKEQWAVPFDIDGLDIQEGKEHEAASLAARTAIESLALVYDHTAVTFTGNGVQFFVLLHKPIVSEEYFEQTREHYKSLCRKIQAALNERGIKGTVDSSVWSKGRLMRLPDTMNIKPGKPNRMAAVLQATMQAQDFDVAIASGLAEIKVEEQLNEAVLKNYPKPDTPSVCSGCKFLVHCKEKPNDIDEPAWYAMTSITARLDDGRALTHEYSEGHRGYNHYETENKIEQALVASGPRTCKDISTRWDGCHTCDYYGKVSSPIMIKGPNYIASQDFGYRTRKVDKDGNVRVGPPAYQDLIKAFIELHPYKVVEDSDQVIIYNGKHWRYVTDRWLKGWVSEVVKPEPNNTEMSEFVAQFKAKHITDTAKLIKDKGNRLNFQNVVLDLNTGETTPHSPDYGFFNVLPFPYDPRATAPTWDRFLNDIMEGDPERVELLKEFGGYSISGDDCWIQKALLLVGDGANGKSVYMEILGEVVGIDNHAAIPMQEMDNEQVRHHLVNKLFNYSEETSMNALADSSIFKALVTGGKVSVKQLFVQPHFIDNRAKIILSANNLPYTKDKSHGFLRRLSIVQFNRRFTPGSEGHDYFIKDKLKLELPGICNSLLAAYGRLKERRVLSAADHTRDTLEQYQQESDTVLMFLDNNLEFEAEHQEEMPVVYEQYKMQSEIDGYRPLDRGAFSKQVLKLRPDLSIHATRVGGKGVRVIKGIKLQKGF